VATVAPASDTTGHEDRVVRPVITFVILASGLKYVGVGTYALGWILCAVLLAAGIAWLAYARPWEPSRDETTSEEFGHP